MTTIELIGILRSRGMTQRRIAVVLGVTQAAVSQYATGKRIPCGLVMMRLLEVVNG